MNLIYFVMIVSSLVLITIIAPETAFPIMLGGAKHAITLSLSLLAIYAIWLSVLDIMDKVGINKLLNKIFRPITRKLFKGEDEKSTELISMNFSANLLGMGGAATPLGIKAMENMQDGSDEATDNMILFMIINATSIQLLPATIIGMRAEAGSSGAGDIIIPSLIATTVATVFGVVMAKILASFKSKPNNRQNGVKSSDNAIHVVKMLPLDGSGMLANTSLSKANQSNKNLARIERKGNTFRHLSK